MKLSDFTDQEIAVEHARRKEEAKIIAEKSRIANAQYEGYTVKDVVIEYPTKFQFNDGVDCFFFLFKQKSGKLIDFYSAACDGDRTEFDENDDVSNHERVGEFIPDLMDACDEASYEYRGETPEDYKGFIKTVTDYLRTFGYTEFKENEYDL